MISGLRAQHFSDRQRTDSGEFVCVLTTFGGISRGGGGGGGGLSLKPCPIRVKLDIYLKIYKHRVTGALQMYISRRNICLYAKMKKLLGQNQLQGVNLTFTA